MKDSLTDVRDVAGLCAAIDAGRRVKYVFFWGHTPADRGSVGKECLSQWYPAELTVDGARYATAEHFMMASKARLFGDTETEARVLAAGHPNEAKQLGRQVRGFDEAAWVDARFQLIVRGNVAKFGQNERLRDFLVGTGQRVLVEASPQDRIWGIGLTADDPRAGNPAKWLSLNLLGFALMEARAQLTATPQ